MDIVRLANLLKILESIPADEAESVEQIMGTIRAREEMRHEPADPISFRTLQRTLKDWSDAGVILKERGDGRTFLYRWGSRKGRDAVRRLANELWG